jgi:predicted nuclease with TOPRIM domain
MTDEQIVKALEICSSDAFNDSKERCTGCKYDGADKNLFCFEVLEKDALDLINRQNAELSKKDTEIDILIRKKESLRDENSELKAEVDRLQLKITELQHRLSELGLYDLQVEVSKKIEKEIKTEAIKEFWEKAKRTIQFRTQPYVYITDGDNLVKEMTEVQE